MDTLIVSVVFWIVVALALPSNALAIMVVLLDKHMRTTTNILIFNLAFADLIFIGIYIPFALKYSFDITLDSWWCKMYGYVFLVCSYVTVYTLIALSLDIYLSFVSSITSIQWRTDRISWVTNGTIWAVFSILNIPALVFYSVKHDEQCQNVAQGFEKTTGQIIFTIFFFSAYLLPLSAMLFMYGQILMRMPRRFKTLAQGSVTKENLQARWKLTLMIAFIMFGFAICWFPLHFIYLMENFQIVFGPMEGTFPLFVAQVMACVNGALNHYIYIFFQDNIYNSIRRFLGWKRKAKKRVRFETATDMVTKEVTIHSSIDVRSSERTSDAVSVFEIDALPTGSIKTSIYEI